MFPADYLATADSDTGHQRRHLRRIHQEAAGKSQLAAGHFHAALVAIGAEDLIRRGMQIAEGGQIVGERNIPVARRNLGAGDHLVDMDVLVIGGGPDETQDLAQGLFRARAGEVGIG